MSFDRMLKQAVSRLQHATMTMEKNFQSADAAPIALLGIVARESAGIRRAPQVRTEEICILQ